MAELQHWRDVAGPAKKALSERMGHDASYVGKVESGHARPTAELRYLDGQYHPTQRRILRNMGTEPITRYVVRVSVDRFPGDPEHSDRLYREHPLTWEELCLRPMRRRRDALVRRAGRRRLQGGLAAVRESLRPLPPLSAPFALPDEAEDARRGVAELHSALGRASRLHHFAKGSGVAAPQLGIGRAAAVVRTPDGETITLLDPHVIEESADTDEQHEGCWSFFDVRGKVARSLGIHVAHQDVDGTPRITSFGEAVARLVAHEVDHLHGVLYVDRMPPGACTVRVGDYRGTGARWQY